MKQKNVILELYMEMWYCYKDGESMAYALFTTPTLEEAEKICNDKKYNIVQIIDLELQDLDEDLSPTPAASPVPENKIEGDKGGGFMLRRSSSVYNPGLS